MKKIYYQKEDLSVPVLNRCKLCYNSPGNLLCDHAGQFRLPESHDDPQLYIYGNNR